MDSNAITYIVLKPNGKPEIVKRELTYEKEKEFVDGFIEIVPMDIEDGSRFSVDIILNEEGKLRRMDPNLKWYNDMIVGPAIFALADNETGKFVDMDKEHQKAVLGFIEENQILMRTHGTFEPKVGETFIYENKGVALRCVMGGSCQDCLYCFFYGQTRCEIPCTGGARTDKTPVYFEEIKPNDCSLDE